MTTLRMGATAYVNVQIRFTVLGDTFTNNDLIQQTIVFTNCLLVLWASMPVNALITWKEHLCFLERLTVYKLALLELILYM